MEGGMDGGRDGGKDGGMEGGMEGGRDGGMKTAEQHGPLYFSSGAATMSSVADNMAASPGTQSDHSWAFSH